MQGTSCNLYSYFKAIIYQRAESQGTIYKMKVSQGGKKIQATWALGGVPLDAQGHVPNQRVFHFFLQLYIILSMIINR